MRLDVLLSEKFKVSRTRAQNLIKTGGVTIDGVRADKPAAEVEESALIEVSDTLKYASVGGLKLENALNTFSISVAGKKCLDVGAANGGFTDCLLKKGASSVTAVDLHIAFPNHLLSDPRVALLDGVNVKDLHSVLNGEQFELVTVDLSFISLCGLFPILASFLTPNGIMIALFKPQFEVGKKSLPKSGVVRDKKAIEKALNAYLDAASAAGLFSLGHCPVPPVFPDKNLERTVIFRLK